MKEIFEKSMELNSRIAKMMGKLDILSVEVNSAMKAYRDYDKEAIPGNYPIGEIFLGNQYLALAEMLAEYGLISKEWT